MVPPWCYIDTSGSDDRAQPRAGLTTQPIHSQPIAMPDLDPGRLDSLTWSLENVTTSLAEMIADAAITDSNAIPSKLLAVYHDAQQLKTSMKHMRADARNIAMGADLR